jgi:hypothetical protein
MIWTANNASSHNTFEDADTTSPPFDVTYSWGIPPRFLHLHCGRDSCWPLPLNSMHFIIHSSCRLPDVPSQNVRKVHDQGTRCHLLRRSTEFGKPQVRAASLEHRCSAVRIILRYHYCSRWSTILPQTWWLSIFARLTSSTIYSFGLCNILIP